MATETRADVDVMDEQIIVHPKATRRGESWFVEARITGRVVIEGEVFDFETVVEIETERADK